MRVRHRRPEDVAVLVDLLAEQQADSAYPVRWPLPIPVADFLVRPTELAAWVAEVDGTIVGHVTVASVDDGLAEAFAAALPTTATAMVAVLFTGTAARGTGVGGALLDTAVAWIRDRELVPVLDVVPLHSTAVQVYRHRGWVEVGSARAEWLGPDFPDLVLMALPPYPSASSTEA